MEPELWIVATAIAAPFLTAAVIPLFHRLLGDSTGYVGVVDLNARR